MRRVFFVLLLSLFLLGCDAVESASVYVGLRNPAPAPAVEIDLLCDYGESVCTPERLRSVAESVFDQVALRPESRARLWWLANSVGDTKIVASYTVPPIAGTSRRAREAHRARVIAAGVTSFERAAAPLFRDFDRRQSPLFEALGKIAMASSHPGREVWLLSNLLEQSSLGAFECGQLPPPERFRAQTARLLPPGSLRGVRVVAVYAAPDAIARCAVSVERFRAITELYDVSIGQAGGRFVLSPTSLPYLAFVFLVPLVPARFAPLFVRNFLVWLQARRDGKFGFYARFEVVLRWMGRFLTWDPVNNPVHRRIDELLQPDPRLDQHERERQAAEKQLAKLTSFWLLVVIIIALYLGDLLGSIQLLKTIGVDGIRRVLIGFALSAMLFSLPLLAVRFYTKKTKHWFALIMTVLLVLVAIIGTLQVSETATSTGEFHLQDALAGTLLALAVVGPAILAKFCITTLIPVWQLRKERSRLLKEIRRTKVLQRMAERYVQRYQFYREWYLTHAAQIASVYRRAFARIFLKVHKNPELLRRMLDDDSLRALDEVTAHPELVSGEPVEKPRLVVNNTRDATKAIAELETSVRENKPVKPENPYRKD